MVFGRSKEELCLTGSYPTDWIPVEGGMIWGALRAPVRLSRWDVRRARRMSLPKRRSTGNRGSGTPSARRFVPDRPACWRNVTLS